MAKYNIISWAVVNSVSKVDFFKRGNLTLVGQVRTELFFLFFIFFQVLIEFVTILFLLYVLVFWPQGMWDLVSPMRDRT